MIFRLTQKLSDRIEAGVLSALPLHENPLADWSAHLFVVQRVQYILLSNTPSLYSTVMYRKGITDASSFIDRALSSIRMFLELEGQADAFERFIAPASGAVQFARALNRSVSGSMTDLVKHASFMLTDGELSPHDVGVQLNRIPMSALKKDRSGYGFPRDVFAAMVSTARAR